MIGSAGVVLPAAEFRIESVPEMNYYVDGDGEAPKGELCIRGPCLFTTYYKKEDEYHKVVDSDGFFHTGKNLILKNLKFKKGDIVELCKSGNIKIIDRLKNIFKLSQGEYVAVESVESVLSTASALDQIWVYGNSSERYLVAVVYPNLNYFKGHYNVTDMNELCNSKEMNKVILDQLTKLANDVQMKGYEKVKKIFLTNEPFSVENGMLTPSYKLKRHDLLKKYKNEIDKLYQSST